MKNLIVGCAIAVASVSVAVAADLVQTCQLAGSVASLVRVTREHRIADTEVYKLQYAGRTEYFFGDEERSRGGPVKLACIAGRNQHVLITYGEFTSSYKQGFVLLFNRLTGKVERLDFAEKGLPEWLYLSENEAIVILPTYGTGDNGATPYVAYRLIKGKTEQPEPEGVVIPAAPAGYDAIKLQQ